MQLDIHIFVSSDQKVSLHHQTKKSWMYVHAIRRQWAAPWKKSIAPELAELVRVEVQIPKACCMYICGYVCMYVCMYVVQETGKP